MHFHELLASAIDLAIGVAIVGVRDMDLMEEHNGVRKVVQANQLAQTS